MPLTTQDLYSQATEALAQGRGADASSLLARALRRPGLPLNEQIQIRCALAEAWLLQDDIRQATETVEGIQREQDMLEEQVSQESARIAAQYEAPAAFETVAIAPKRGQVSIQFVALGWMPR